MVRGDDGVLRGFFNVCRHHAAAVMTEPQGCAKNLRCPYHGWTYTLEGALKGTPEFQRRMPLRSQRARTGAGGDGGLGTVGVRAARCGRSQPRRNSSAPALIDEIAALQLDELHWFERRHYFFDCNWKVFVDNYLDGGYHVPHLHKGLNSVLDFKNYTIENGLHHCLQSSPMVKDGEHAEFSAVRGGDRALYYWLHPNFMINWYEGVMDTNLVLPLGLDRTEVIFDFYFADVSGAGARTQPRQHRRRQHHPGRGHGDLQVGAARAELARVLDRAPVGAARGGRAPVPSAAACGPDRCSCRITLNQGARSMPCAPRCGRWRR